MRKELGPVYVGTELNAADVALAKAQIARYYTQANTFA